MAAHAAHYAALAARDSRFDGVFFVGVSTTGIYCRPICPARTPARTRCAFFATAAQAEAAGFRACFRCRPELAPGNPRADAERTLRSPQGSDPAQRGSGVSALAKHASVDKIDALVAAAAARIGEGALNEDGLDRLAGELGVSARHLRRALEARLGVSPIELAQSRRVALAKQLLHDTALPVTEIAFAAGFASVRRFNAAFAARVGCAPSRLRGVPRAASESVVLRLDYREPYDWPRLLAFLRARQVPGVEQVGADEYRRIAHVDGRVGEIAVRHEHGRLLLAVSPPLLPVLMPLVARVRRMFDLDARPDMIAGVLGADRTLAPMLAARPGLRLPGAIDPFEAAIRALLGQQVSVAAATTLAGRFAARFGATCGDGVRFPTAGEVARAGAKKIVKIGMPMARASAIEGFARAIADGAVRLDAPCELEPFVERLVALRGIGPWTAHYLAMRALHLPDAFPATDLGVKKALRGNAEARAEAWRPFRSYAVMHLWTALSERTRR